jgi:two-component system phosphate regulon sensor histidine kinase PhoR
VKTAKTARKHSLWLYYGLSVAITVVALLTVTWYVADRFRDFFIDQLEITLEARARGIAEDIERQGIKTGGYTDSCLALQRTDPTIRVTLIDDQGGVLCDSDADSRTMESHRGRPEIIQAMNGHTGSMIRYSKTLQAVLLYVAVPLDLGQTRWVVRTALSLSSINQLLSELFNKLLLLLAVLLMIIFGVGAYVYRKINPPLEEIRLGAERFAHGRFAAKLPDYQVREIADLAAALNQMATQLDRLENLRREFVANVSHELKTPVTSIQGFAETLLEGARDNPEDLERFLQIIARQSGRLADIIDDLLTLSRLESAPLDELLAIDRYALREILEACREACRSRADEKHIAILIDCSAEIQVMADRSLLTQAVINLVENAVKYSPEHTTVTVSGARDRQRVRITVVDQGPGIPEHHVPRLFERFYRADKARSRKLGGTGLGLAIVKHIANVHQGDVEVVTRIGQGSTFAILLPVD